MSRSAAEVRARSLRESLLDHGVPKVSIEIQQGRPGTPNGRWFDDRFVGSMGHHIVSRRSQGLTPGLALIKRGRIDVPGPLANGYGGFDRVARIICMGWANHPGAGGPYTLPSGRIPASNGRPYLFGWEHEGGLVLADWTDEFRDFMGSCHAGTLDWLGLRDTSHIEHKTWTDRKIDRLNYTLAAARAEIRDNWDGDDDMTPAQAEMLKDLHSSLVNGNGAQATNPRTGDKVSVRYGVQEAWQTAEQLYEVLANSNTAQMRRPGGGTASVRYGVERSWAGVEALKAMVAELATGPASDPDEFLDRVQQRVEQGIAAGVDAEIPAVVAAVLDALGDRAGLSQDDVVAAVKRALREGADA